MTTPDQLGREVGAALADSLADGIERIILRLTEATAQTRAEQAELRDELVAMNEHIHRDMEALANRIESVARAVNL